MKSRAFLIISEHLYKYGAGTATQTGQKTSLRSAQVFINQTGRIQEESPLSYDPLFPQVVNLFGVIAKLAQPHVRVLGKDRRGSLR